MKSVGNLVSSRAAKLNQNLSLRDRKMMVKTSSLAVERLFLSVWEEVSGSDLLRRLFS